MGGGDNKKILKNGWETSYYSDCEVLPVLKFIKILVHFLNWSDLLFWLLSLHTENFNILPYTLEITLSNFVLWLLTLLTLFLCVEL